MLDNALENTNDCKLAVIPTLSVIENETALRPVDEKNIEFIQLADSVAQYGVLEPILVRELAADPKTGDKRYGLINGLQRWTAAKLAGQATIPANVRSFSDAEVLKMQIITNHHRVKTHHASYARQLLRLLAGDNTLTKTGLASQLNVSLKALDSWLSLGDLEPNVAELVDQNKIPLISGYALAKLKPAAQQDLLEQAQSMEGKQFLLIADQRAKADRAEAKKGGTGTPEFQARMRLQNLSEIKVAYNAPQIREAIRAKMPAEEQNSFEGGWKAALEFAMHIDPLTIEADKAAFEAEMKKRAEKKAQAQLEKQQKAQDPARILGIAPKEHAVAAS